MAQLCRSSRTTISCGLTVFEGQKTAHVERCRSQEARDANKDGPDVTVVMVKQPSSQKWQRKATNSVRKVSCSKGGGQVLRPEQVHQSRRQKKIMTPPSHCKTTPTPLRNGF